MMPFYLSGKNMPDNIVNVKNSLDEINPTETKFISKLHEERERERERERESEVLANCFRRK